MARLRKSEIKKIKASMSPIGDKSGAFIRIARMTAAWMIWL
jgi:CRISPR/Cas system-associated endoribonuclease Cas2